MISELFFRSFFDFDRDSCLSAEVRRCCCCCWGIELLLPLLWLRPCLALFDLDSLWVDVMAADVMPPSPWWWRKCGCGIWGSFTINKQQSFSNLTKTIISISIVLMNWSYLIFYWTFWLNRIEFIFRVVKGCSKNQQKVDSEIYLNFGHFSINNPN